MPGKAAILAAFGRVPIRQAGLMCAETRGHRGCVDLLRELAGYQSVSAGCREQAAVPPAIKRARAIIEQTKSDAVVGGDCLAPTS